MKGNRLTDTIHHIAARDVVQIATMTDLVTYKSLGTGTGIRINAIVDRQQLDVVNFGDVSTTAHEIRFAIANDPTLGVTTITKGKDTIEVSLVEGADPTTMLVTEIANSDPGMWELVAVR